MSGSLRVAVLQALVKQFTGNLAKA